MVCLFKLKLEAVGAEQREESPPPYCFKLCLFICFFLPLLCAKLLGFIRRI